MAATEAGSRAARALDDLYRRHVGEVYRYAYAVLGNRADAEDVTQTTFVNALGALERGEQPRKPGNWLLAIAHNVVRQRWRHARIRPAEVELDAERTPAAEDDDAGPSVSEMVKALGRIPPSQREAIVMREFEGRSYKEIAEILGITTTALETLLFRARRSLTEELESLVTCDLAEQAISRRLDGRLGRKERRRLAEHVLECPACARFELAQRRTRKTFKGLAILPLPATLTLFKGTNSAAAASLPTIGLAAAGTGGSAAAGGAATAGGLALGGLAVKAAAVVAAVGVAGGVGYKGAQEIHDALVPAKPAEAQRAQNTQTRPARVSKAVAKATPAGGRGHAVGTAKQKVRDATRAESASAAPVALGAGREHAPGQEKKDATSGSGHQGKAATSGDASNGPSANSHGAARQGDGPQSTPNGERRGQTTSAAAPRQTRPASTAKAKTGRGGEQRSEKASGSHRGVKASGSTSGPKIGTAANAPGQAKSQQGTPPKEKAGEPATDPKEPKEAKPKDPKSKPESEPAAAPEDTNAAPAEAENGAAHGNSENAGPKK